MSGLTLLLLTLWRDATPRAEISAAPMAGRLMLDAWWLPNLRKYGANPNNGPTGTASNPYRWRPPDHVQKRFVEYMNTTNTGAPDGSDFRAYIPSDPPYKTGTSEFCIIN